MIPEVYCTAFLLALYALPVVLVFAALAAVSNLLQRIFPNA